MNRRESLSVGKVVGVHGIRGTLRIYSHSGDIADFEQGARLVFKSPKGDERICTIAGCKPHGRHFLLDVAEIRGRDQAEAAVGADLLVSRADLPDLETDTYYWDDIIGLSVFDGDVPLGRVVSIIPTPGNDVYVVADAGTGREVMVPAVKSVIRQIDLGAGTMRVRLPDTK
ncbi:MAG: ribosome maturation factor RimM [Thermodesulfobacteriota bacterium]